MFPYSTNLIPELQYYFSKFIIESSVNKNLILYPTTIEEYLLGENKSFIRMLFDDYYDHNTYRYLYRKLDYMAWPESLRPRLSIFQNSLSYYACDFGITPPDSGTGNNSGTDNCGCCNCDCDLENNHYTGSCTQYNPDLISCPFQGICRRTISNMTGCPNLSEFGTCPEYEHNLQNHCPVYDPRYIMECNDSGRCPDSIRCPNSGMICNFYTSGWINPHSCFIRSTSLVQTCDNGSCYPTDSTSVFTLNFFDLKFDDFRLLNELLIYRTDSTAASIADIVYSDLTTNLSKLIYIYLDLKLNENYFLYDDLTLISSSDNPLESTYECYVADEIFKFISNKEVIQRQHQV